MSKVHSHWGLIITFNLMYETHPPPTPNDESEAIFTPAETSFQFYILCFWANCLNVTDNWTVYKVVTSSLSRDPTQVQPRGPGPQQGLGRHQQVHALGDRGHQEEADLLWQSLKVRFRHGHTWPWSFSWEEIIKLGRIQSYGNTLQ